MTFPLTTRQMLDIAEEQHRQNSYAEKLGLRNAHGIESHGPPPPKSSNIVGFIVDERDIVFVGEDAVKVNKLISEFAKRIEAQKEASRDGILPGLEQMILSRVSRGRIDLTEVDGVPRVILWRGHWNDWLYCIYRMNHGMDLYNYDQ